MSITDLDWRLRNIGGRMVLAAADPVVVLDPEPEVPEIVETLDQKLRYWTNGEGWTWNNITYVTGNPNIIARADITWPDLSTGVYTLLVTNETYGQWDSRKLTHIKSGKTITQTVKSRDTNGNVSGYSVTVN